MRGRRWDSESACASVGRERRREREERTISRRGVSRKGEAKTWAEDTRHCRLTLMASIGYMTVCSCCYESASRGRKIVRECGPARRSVAVQRGCYSRQCRQTLPQPCSAREKSWAVGIHSCKVRRKDVSRRNGNAKATQRQRRGNAHGAVCAGDTCWRCQQHRADALVIIDILQRLGTWLGHLGHSSRCAAQGLVLKSQCGDRSGGGDGGERRIDERDESSFPEVCILASVPRRLFCGCLRVLAGAGVRRAACQCRSTFVVSSAVRGERLGWAWVRVARDMCADGGLDAPSRRELCGVAGALISQPRSRLDECVVLASESDRGALDAREWWARWRNRRVGVRRGGYRICSRVGEPCLCSCGW